MLDVEFHGFNYEGQRDKYEKLQRAIKAVLPETEKDGNIICDEPHRIRTNCYSQLIRVYTDKPKGKTIKAIAQICEHYKVDLQIVPIQFYEAPK